MDEWRLILTDLSSFSHLSPKDLLIYQWNPAVRLVSYTRSMAFCNVQIPSEPASLVTLNKLNLLILFEKTSDLISIKYDDKI